MHSFKILTCIVLLLAVIFAFSSYTNRILMTTSQDIASHVDQIEKTIKEGDWDKTEEQLQVLESNWDKTEKKWTVLIDHFEIDNIDISLSRMSKYIEAKEQALALAEAGAVKNLIRHIPDKETLTFKNIF